MWPALPQLLELLPHFARLAPALDRFLQQRSGNDEATRQALAETTDGLRTELQHVADRLHSEIAQTTASHTGIYRQINEQSEKIAEMGSTMRSIEATFDTMERRTRRIEKRLGKLIALCAGCMVLLVIAIVVGLVRR
jgi:methyl-accepting chemotaxis protein